jgi:DNA-binding transcriptional LysR family regulator
MYDAVVGLCRDAGFEPVIRHEVAETSTLVTFVAAALGVAIVPEPVSDLVVAGAIYRPLSSSARMELVTATRADDDSALLAGTMRVLRRQILA